MDKYTRIWIRLMTFFRKYWGCHQIHERSFSFYNYQFPLCARCTGILFGYFLALILLIVNVKVKFYICLFMTVPLVVDGTLQYFLKVMSNNIRRFITGILFGFAIVQIIAHLVYFIKEILV